MGENRIAPSRLRHIADRLIGRKRELGKLTKAWSSGAVRLVTIVAWGGVGKTSLVAHWQAELARRNYDGADYFDWSFYSQGTREQGGASTDTFIAAALEFFGGEKGKELARSPSAWEKGAQLAQWVGQRRGVLVLDGLEPLQHPPGTLAGKLNDPALEALLKGLAQRNAGLCVVTTREAVTDLAPYRGQTVQEWELEHLSEIAGAALLHNAGATRAGPVSIGPDDSELRAASAEVNGHALTLTLLGSYLARAHGGDIRRRHEVKFEKADARIQGGHAFKAMAAYEKWLAGGGEDGARQLAVLRLLGLFDRPADTGCLAALRKPPAIVGLTESVVSLDEADWNLTVSSLGACGLISGSGIGNPQSFIDCHPLLREYFARRLREGQPEACREGHWRLFEHLKASVPYCPEGLDGLEPLYQAVAHGCQAGRSREAFEQVYHPRIWRDTFFSTSTLGTFGAEVAALTCFHGRDSTHPLPELSAEQGALIRRATGYCLRPLGQFKEAAEWLEAAALAHLSIEKWLEASIDHGITSVVYGALGELRKAECHARKALDCAKKSENRDQLMDKLGLLGDVLHTMGKHEEANKVFRKLEHMSSADWDAGNASNWNAGNVSILPYYWLYRLSNFVMNSIPLRIPEVRKKLEQALQGIQQDTRTTVAIGLIHLDLGLSYLLDNPDPPQEAHQHLEKAVSFQRKVARFDVLPRALLARAKYHRLKHDFPASQRDLNEAIELVIRFETKLLEVDCHIEYALLIIEAQAQAAALGESSPHVADWSAEKHVLQAERLVGQTGYLRVKRDLELLKQQPRTP